MERDEQVETVAELRLLMRGVERLIHFVETSAPKAITARDWEILERRAVALAAANLPVS